MKAKIETTIDVTTEVYVKFEGHEFDNLDEEAFAEQISENIDDCMENESSYSDLVDYAILSRSMIFEYDKSDVWFREPICEAMANGISQELHENGRQDLLEKWLSSWKDKLSFTLEHDWNGEELLIYIYITVK